MNPVSAIDAIGPAFRRTRSILFEPFRLGPFFKLALVAALAEGCAGARFPTNASNFNFGGHHKPNLSLLASHALDPHLPAGITAVVVLVALLIGLLIVIPLMLLITYLLCRLRLTVLDLVIYRRGRVGEAWSKYGRASWRYFGLSLLIGFVFLTMLALSIAPFVPLLMRVFGSVAQQGAAANPWPALVALLPVFGIVLLLSLVAVLVKTVVRDFLLPPMALEDASIGTAFDRFVEAARGDVAGFAIYVLLRFVLLAGLAIASMIVVLVPFALLGLMGFGVGALLYHLLWAGGLGGRAIVIAYGAVAGLIFTALYILAMIAVFGTLGIFKRSYAIIFFGSRYSALGNLLEPPPAPVVPVDAPEPPPTMFPGAEAPPAW